MTLRTGNAPRFVQLTIVGLLIAGALGISFLYSPQPRFQGRPLTDWLDDLTAGGAPYPLADTDEILAARHQKGADAIRKMGTNTLEWLLVFLVRRQEPSFFRRQLEDLLQNQSGINFRLPRIPDRCFQTIQAFRVLGPVAKSAIPNLSKLLDREPPCYSAFDALEGIGPDSVHVLVQYLNSTNRHVRLGAIIALGEFGTASQEALPAIAAIAVSTDVRLASESLMVLSEVHPDPRELSTLFSNKLNETVLVGPAAFALGRIGPPGVLPLLHGLTNDNQEIRRASIGALSPEIRYLRRENYPTNYSFRGVICAYNSRMLSIGWYLYQKGSEADLIATAVTPLLDHPDSAVRLEMVNVLSRCGHAGFVALSRMVTDRNQKVRETALATLRELGISTRKQMPDEINPSLSETSPRLP